MTCKYKQIYQRNLFVKKQKKNIWMITIIPSWSIILLKLVLINRNIYIA